MSPVLLITEEPAEHAVIQHETPRHANRLVVNLFLQISHRLGAVALLATIGTWVMMYMIRDFHVPLAIAGSCADVGLCSAMIALMLSNANPRARREASGVAIFNLVIFVLALYLMVFARLDVIRSAASEFFTPTPPVAAHS